MGYRLLDPQLVLERLLRPVRSTSTTKVQVINNNLPENDSRRDHFQHTTVNPRSSEHGGLNNFNNMATTAGFELKAPVNSPVMQFEAPPVRIAFTDRKPPRPRAAHRKNQIKHPNLSDEVENTICYGPQTAISLWKTEYILSVPKFQNTEESIEVHNYELKMPKKKSKPTKLRKLVSEFRTIRSDTDLISKHQFSLQQVHVQDRSFRRKVGRPKGAHHKNHPMFIPGLADHDSDDEFEALSEATAASSKLVNQLIKPAEPSRMSERAIFTFVPGPPENSRTPEQPLVIRGTRVSSNETQKVAENKVDKQISPNSDEGGIIKELEDLMTLNPDSRMSDVTISATSERPINCLGHALLPGGISDTDSEPELGEEPNTKIRKATSKPSQSVKRNKTRDRACNVGRTIIFPFKRPFNGVRRAVTRVITSIRALLLNS
ncbi:uncharacterized protein LOC134821035 [Bolinopsis microptera]|uniref:uncharacterized protein LOC134821035 n=1 Tax=Bolinopsis microptera TaxID=2820187 RepID=UPI00307AAD58